MLHVPCIEDAAGYRDPLSLCIDPSENTAIDRSVNDALNSCDDRLEYSRVFAPAILGRYMITSDPDYKEEIRKPIPTKQKLGGNIVDFFCHKYDISERDSVEAFLVASEPLLARDYLTLLGLIHIARSPSLFMDGIDGGMIFNVSELRKTLNMTSGGVNTQSVRESLKRLNDITFRLEVSFNGGEYVVNEFTIFEYLDIEKHPSTAEDGKRTYASRVWHIKFSNSFFSLLNRDYSEQVGHDLNALLELRRKTGSLASLINRQTNFNKTFDRRIRTHMNNINTHIDDNKWAADSSYRSRLANKVRRIAKDIGAVITNASKSLLTFPNMLLSFP